MNKEKFKEILQCYKEDFPLNWPNESYKWKAVKCFQDNWDVNADDFPDMVDRAFAKTETLLIGPNYFPKGMIQEFAKVDQEKTREMFIQLFDESVDFIDRIERFRKQSDEMNNKYGQNKWRQHYQSENPISVYLWLRYPDKYYIYKYTCAKDAAAELDSDYVIKRGDKSNNVRNAKAIYDEICEGVKQDDELVEMFKRSLTDECYSDPELRTLAIDVAFYISAYYPERNRTSDDGYWPSEKEYSPGLNKAQWKDYLENFEMPKHSAPIQMLKAILEQGGEATATDLSAIYGGEPSRYIGCAVNLGKRVKAHFNLKPCLDDGKERFFPIPFTGRYVKGTNGNLYSYRLREELKEALEEMDLSKVSVYASDNDSIEMEEVTVPYAWFVGATGNDEDGVYRDFSDEWIEQGIWKNNWEERFENEVNSIEVGDRIVIKSSYTRKKNLPFDNNGKVVGVMGIKAIGTVTENNKDGKSIKVDWEKVDPVKEWYGAGVFRSTIHYVSAYDSKIKRAVLQFVFADEPQDYSLCEEQYVDGGTIGEEIEDIANRPYTKTDFLKDVYMDETSYDKLVTVLKRKKNLILQGAPGVGKTFAAKRLCYSIMGEKDESRVQFVQFHQNYSYEDFVMGYKPDGEGFKMQQGIFYKFCKKASEQPQRPFFFIIDEINRGNMSKIFGELLMLIENDYRGEKITLAYDETPFAVPENLYIIGMMNTADRSLAMIDYALRRRFSFFEMAPGFDKKGFADYQKGFVSDLFDDLIDMIISLNEEIVSDRSLGKGFRIGHSYFCNLKDAEEETLKNIVEFDIIPMLEEYWFDDDAKLTSWSNNLRGIFQ